MSNELVDFEKEARDYSYWFCFLHHLRLEMKTTDFHPVLQLGIDIDRTKIQSSKIVRL